jgi:hypothetical protein
MVLSRYYYDRFLKKTRLTGNSQQGKNAGHQKGQSEDWPNDDYIEAWFSSD